MRLSVVIPWCNRLELGRSLSENASQLQQPGIEVLVVNGGGRRLDLEGISKDHGWPRLRIVHAPTTAFNKPECLNLGVAFARANLIFVLDADVILTGAFVQKAISAVSNDANFFVSVAKVIESAPEKVPHRWNRNAAVLERRITTRITTPTGTTATVVHSVTREGTRTGPGLIVVGRKQFIAAGGFNSNLTGWGFEDYDFQIRLQLRLGLKRKTFGRAIHLSHENVDGRATDYRNQRICYENYDRGLFTGTYRADIKRLKPHAVATRSA
ncbi:MAG: glycosyltransferase [Acidobacteriota bacterium]